MGKDPKFGSELVERFIKKVMLDGKKTTATKLFYGAVDLAAKEANVDAADFITQAVDNVKPALEIRARRVGGSNYTVPVPVSPARQDALAIRWIVDSARKKSGTSFDEILKRELVDAYNGVGDAVRKREDVEKMAEANKAFAHFKW